MPRPVKKRIYVRHAEHEDYNEVMDINKVVYGGNDYLPAMYHNYLQDPAAHCFVAVSEGEIVGFSIAYVLDGGERVVSVASRTKPSVQGMNVMGQLRAFALDKVRELHPHLKIWAYTTAETKRISPEGSVINKWHFLVYILDQKKYNIASVRQEFGAVKIQEPPLEELKDLFLNSSIIPELFRDQKYLISLYSWFPLSLTSGGFMKMAKSSIVITTKDKESEKYKVLSYSAVSKSSRGVQLRFQITHTGVDTKTIAAHVMAHLIRTSRISQPEKRVAFIGMLPLDVDMDELKNMLQTFLGNAHDPGSEYGALVHERLPKASL